MTKIENQTQYEWAVKRVEDLLPLVKDDTPLNDPNSIELELPSNLVAFACGCSEASYVRNGAQSEITITTDRS